MKKKNKRSVIRGLFISSLLLLMSSCFNFRTTEEQVRTAFKGRDPMPVLKKTTVDSRTLSAVETGKMDSTVLVFIHGSPGSWAGWESYLNDSSLYNHFKLIAIDRPGYGQWDYGKVEVSLEKQAYYIKKMIEIYKGQKIILIGHSYGGPVAVRMAIDYPELIYGLVLAAPSISPQHEKIYWVQYIGAWKATRWLLPKAIQVSHQEIIPLKAELTSMEPLWEKVNCPVVYIHGMKDQFVPVGNADFAREKLSHTRAIFWIEKDLNHFIPWKRADLIKKAIHQLVDESW
jgi:pimeloyl-ACP methyl ester carboxylesterase